MKRRIASKVVSRQDVCLFCTFRPNVSAIASAAKVQHAARTYNTSSIRSSPTGVGAAQQSARDDNDDDSPMLKQNAGLLSSFPSRKPPSLSTLRQQTPVSARSDDSSEPQNRPDTRRNRFNPRPQNGESSIRANFAEQGDKGSFRQPRGNQENGRSAPNFRPMFGANARDGKPQDTSQFSEERRQPRNKRAFGQDGQKHGPWSGSGTRRLVLNKGAQPHDDTQSGTILSGWNAASGFRSQRGSQEPIFQKPEPADAYRPANRDSCRGPDNFSDRVQTPYRSGSKSLRAQAATADGAADRESASTEAGEAPAGTSFDIQEDSRDSHHRKGSREDRRKSRAARLEMEEEAEEVQTTNASVPSPRGGVRAGAFDFEMAEAEEALYGRENGRRKKNKKQKNAQVERARPSVKLLEFMSVGQLAKALGVQLDPFIQKLEEEGFEGARYDNILDAQTSAMFADLYGFEAILAEEESAIDLVARPPPEDISGLPPRPPIVTIMGHVDHGKTTILDFLRKSSVVATEHGGITQHIGAFSVVMPGSNRQITFLDTPGHAAFLEMRRRGANVTDIVVLVVAADDSVKPQTVEAIKHAIEAKVQIIVAINKVDKEDANVERVKQDLTRHEIVVEDYGGDYQAIPVSGKTGQGMGELEEAILTLADVHDFRAEQDGLAEGTILESKVTSAGRVATVLVRRGTLRPGDFIVAGTTWARVRTLRNDAGVLVTEAPPGTPVQVDGWRGEDPTAGLEVLQAEDEQQAKDAIDYRLEQRDSVRASVDMAAINEARNEEADARAKVLAWEAEQEWAKKSYGLRPKENAGWVEPEAGGGPKQVHFVVKADVAGSVEAVVAAVAAVGNNEIVANVIHSGTGQITESDIRMLSASGEKGYAISFNQPVDGTVVRLAEAAELEILDHNIIYKVTDVVKEKLAEQLPPIITQKVHGEAEIGQIFEIRVKKNKVRIAGCKVTNGTVSRAKKVRVQRNGQVVYTGTLHSLKNVKKDVTEMRKGTECGMGFEDWDDFREGDQVQCFEELEEKRTLY